MVPPTDLDDFSLGDLKRLVLKLFEEVADLRRTVAAHRDEIIRLKGGPGRPNIKPSGMDKATEPKAPSAGGEPRRKGSKTSKLSIDEERTVKVATPPREPLNLSMGATVRDHRNAVRDRSESLSAIDRNHCPHSPESARRADVCRTGRVAKDRRRVWA